MTGTDTGVGKTVVTAALAHGLRLAGHAVRVAKPVATGADGVPDDARLLADAAGVEWSDVTRWAFPAAAAPPVAARLAGVEPPSIAELSASAGRPTKDGWLLVEGVGGLLCPLTDRETVADLAAAVGLPLVVVARRSLGTLNHTLLTLEAAAARGLAVAGVVVCETEPPEGPAAAANVDELRRRGVPVRAVVRHRPGGPAAADVWADLAGVDWGRPIPCRP